MAFRAMPLWGKCVAIGGGAALFGGYYELRLKNWSRETVNVLLRNNVANRAERERNESTWAKLKDSNASLQSVLTDELFERLKIQRTSLGSLLANLINPVVHYPGETLPCRPPDHEAFEKFEDLLVPLLKEYQNGNIQQPLNNFQELCQFSVPNLDPEQSYIESIQTVCSRSLKGFPFHPKMYADDYIHVETKLKKRFGQLQGLFGGHYVSVRSPESKSVPSHLNFVDGPTRTICEKETAWPVGRGVYKSPAENLAVWVNVGDHLNFVSYVKGGNLSKAVQDLAQAVNAIEEPERPVVHLNYAKNKRFGYLTYNPRDLGTGLHVNIFMRLPNLSSKKNKLKELSNELELQIEKVKSDSGKNSRDLNKVSNAATLGKSEVELVRHVHSGVERLLELEKNQ